MRCDQGRFSLFCGVIWLPAQTGGRERLEDFQNERLITRIPASPFQWWRTGIDRALHIAVGRDFVKLHFSVLLFPFFDFSSSLFGLGTAITRVNRREVLSETDVRVLHCVNGCVRRGFL